MANAASQVLPDDIRFIHRHEQLAIIITGKPEEVSQHLLSLLNRGVTALEGRGMYTGQPRSVLLCAVAPPEMPHLKELVYAVDDQAFVMVNPTDQVWGSGFRKMQPRWRQSKQERRQCH